MKIYLASDHAGFELKEKAKQFLTEKGYEVTDCGAFEFNKDDDYPDFIAKAAQGVSESPESFGIVFGKSGAGETIVANKIKGVRAVLGFSDENVKLSRKDNNANVLSLGSAFVDTNQALSFIDLFINTPFSNEERHTRRIEKIKEIEQQS